MGSLIAVTGPPGAGKSTVARLLVDRLSPSVQANYDTVYDGVLGPWFLDRFLDTTGLDSLDYVLLLPSAGECVDRVLTREGHGFTDEAATRKMHHEFSTTAIDPRHVLAEPDPTPGGLVGQIVAARAAGRLRYSRLDSSGL